MGRLIEPAGRPQRLPRHRHGRPQRPSRPGRGQPQGPSRPGRGQPQGFSRSRRAQPQVQRGPPDSRRNGPFRRFY
ncbi:basic salivary proline-rich protein 2-like [Petaurus breviceps papuanus]|uniref:basic salivary proline-rich protein 2-like n=1 Tax=Petaurus breviceps papuanus TaxID=3040969 RepID=UPI0036DA982A